MTEFELIARYFQRPARRATLGVGDDCALLAIAPGTHVAVSTDLLVAGRHFFADADPDALGWKSLAVNLSDLAAMGATPTAFTLALALPAIDEAWLAAFSRGLFACADAFDCELVGGDTTRGPLTISITILGETADGRALRRDAAVVADDVWVSGALGGAGLALQGLVAQRAGEGPAVDPALVARLDRPQPRVALGRALAGRAQAAIDVSDGLAQDLGHVLAASHVGATLFVDALPTAPSDADRDTRIRFALTGGDDYELCFTAPLATRDAIESAARDAATPVTRIGRIDREPGLRLVDADGAPWHPADDASLAGFDHFA